MIASGSRHDRGVRPAGLRHDRDRSASRSVTLAGYLSAVPRASLRYRFPFQHTASPVKPRTLTRTKPPTPWRDVVRPRRDLRFGELTLAQFAADLRGVAQAAGKRPVYENPAKFLALTFPTHALPGLVKDVVERLAEISAVLKLES